LKRRWPWEEDAEGRDGRVTHSVLGLDAGPPEIRDPSPPRRAGPVVRGPAEDAPMTRSLLGLEDAPLSPYPQRRDPSPEDQNGQGDAGRVARSFLGLAEDARRPLPAELRTRLASTKVDARRSVLGLADVVPPPAPPPVSFAHAPVGVPLARAAASAFSASGEPLPDPTRGLFVEIERRPERAFPVERAILISLAVHFILIFVLERVPGGGGANAGLLAALRPPPQSAEDRVPIVFHAAPGPERDNPKRSDPSDRNRRAGGGDKTRPKADTPFIPPLPGKEGLAPGQAAASRRPPAGSETGREASRTSAASGAPSEKPAVSQERSASSESFRAPAGSGSASSARGLPDLSEKIRDAARSVGASGEGGAGIPNPNGGYMDSGPISFETSWYDWGPYAEEMVRRIKLHWDIPKLAELGWKGKLTIHFNIRIDGSVEGATIVAGSGIPPFDFAAMQAILKSNPFRPLPPDLLKEVPGKTKEGITVTFFYNMRPGRGGTQEGS
jgi:TonB family protein